LAAIAVAATVAGVCVWRQYRVLTSAKFNVIGPRCRTSSSCVDAAVLSDATFRTRREAIAP
jgi:hypothetical protein